MARVKKILTVIAVVILAMVVYFVFIAKKPALKPTTQSPSIPNIATIVTEAQRQQDEQVRRPAQMGDRLYFMTEAGTLSYRDLRNNAVVTTEFRETEGEFTVTKVIPLENAADTLVVLIEKPDETRQFAVIDLTNGAITVRFPDRLQSVAWVADQKKLLGFALSKNDKPYFLTSSLDAKDQQVLTEIQDTDLIALALRNQKIIYRDTGSVKSLDFLSNQTEAIVQTGEDVSLKEVIISPDATTIAYKTDQGLKIFDLEKSARTIISGEDITFINWSSNKLIYGVDTTKSIGIHSFNPATKTDTLLKEIATDNLIPAIDAAFEDTFNKQLIWWSDGYLYIEKLTTP